MEHIDLRSDTVTLPTEEMLDAMRNAKAGDDVYEDDPTAKMLEERSAAILGKEDSVFVPSGTFANQLAIMTHTLRGDEVLIPADNHIVLYEVGASAVLSGVVMRFLKKSSGIIDTGELQNLYRTEDIHHPRTGLICIENAHTQGTAIQVYNSKSVYEFADSKGVPVHLDGARIFNAAVALGTEAKNIAANADSVMFCFSKGLCAPVGSVLAGKREFIRRARKNRKLMGGGMRQVGYLAAACLVALEKITTRLEDDHKNAKYLASCLQDTDIFEIDKNRLDINMVFAKFKSGKDAIKSFNEDRFISFLLDNKIKINPMHGAEYRFVTHYYISRRNIDYFVEAITNYFNKEVF
jgi:threonine aldolase